MVWPFKLEARERHLLRRQAVNDHRNIRPVWLFVFNVEESPFDKTYMQTPKVLRKFLDPIPAYFYIEMTDETEVVEPGVDHGMTHECSVSRAETFRLAEVLSEVKDFLWAEAQYFPRAQDVYQWRNDLFEFQDRAMPSRYWGTSQLEVVYNAPATKMPLDSNAPIKPITIEPTQPTLVFPSILGGTKTE